MANIFFELSIVLIVAMLVSIIMRMIKQPMIIGYIITGILVGPFFLDIVVVSDTIIGLSKIGISFLLFVVGLNLNISTLKEVGKTSLITGIGQVIFTTAVGYGISILLGFTQIQALYLGIALAFSSTIIIIKLLSDKRELDSLYGRLSIGFLIIQDLLVILVLLFISTNEKGLTLGALLGSIFFKVGAVLAALIIATNYVMPAVLKFMAKSQELLFLFSVGWVLVLAAGLEHLGFRIEIGALFAGVSLAGSPYHYEISSRIKPLRDFFVILFFVMLGSQMTLSSLGTVMWPAIYLSVFVLIGNPLIVMAILGWLGYNKRTSFSSGLTVAQISEFSLILILLGQSVSPQIDHTIVSLVTMVGLITIAGSTYLILYSNKIYSHISKYLGIFERKHVVKEKPGIRNPKIILFGHNRIGFSLLKSFKKIKKKFLVIDYDPEVNSLLMKKGIPCQYGDAGDTELLDNLQMKKVELVISTIPVIETNLLIIEKVREKKKKAIIIITSHHVEDAFKLYDAGADYVILPHFLGGDHVATLIDSYGTDVDKFLKEKIKHMAELKSRRKYGHDHPMHL